MTRPIYIQPDAHDDLNYLDQSGVAEAYRLLDDLAADREESFSAGTDEQGRQMRGVKGASVAILYRLDTTEGVPVVVVRAIGSKESLLGPDQVSFYDTGTDL